MKEGTAIQGAFLDQIYYNEDNGFSIGTFLLLEHAIDEAQVKLACKPLENTKALEAIGINIKDVTYGKLTISGYFPKLTQHQMYALKGQMMQHPKYGWQFQVASYESVQAKGKISVVHYLSSEIFAGIGKKTAEKIVDLLGEDAINLILKDASVLDNVPKLSKKQASNIYQTLVEQQGTEQILAPLYSYNLSPQLVMKIYKRYKHQAVEIIEENPYQLIEDIEGIGFLKADELAQKVGISAEHPKRIRAALLFVIDQIALQRGHTYVYREQLLQSALQYLNQKAVKQLTVEQLNAEVQELIRLNKIFIEGEYLFIPMLVHSEKGIVASIQRLQKHELIDDEVIEETLKKLKKQLSISYSSEQLDAIKTALKEPVSIITGGPGTGKTTVVQGILKAYELLHAPIGAPKIKDESNKKSIALAAPTGRAAKRMTETTGMPASTIHRLLGYGLEGEFQINSESPLKNDLIIVDESSMLDTMLAYQLVQSISLGSQLIFVGDDNQLPSVGPGQVLKDLIESEAIPLTRLIKVHRQAEDSSIIALAHAVKQNGLPPDLNVKKPDRLYINCSHDQIKTYLQQVVGNAIKKGYNANDLQVLVPMYRGDCGIDALNLMLQDMFNPSDESKRELAFGQKTFRIGDKVLQLANQPETGVMNGDVGEIIGISFASETEEKEQKLTALFEGQEISYKKGDLIQLTHAYCVSVHKSQGSEYPIVILPITNAYHVMLQKKLIYTAITRAKKSLIVIGEQTALSKGVKNEGDERQTTLKQRFKIQEEDDERENPHEDYFKEHGIPFEFLDEEAMVGITPYDFM